MSQNPKFALNKECNYGFSPIPVGCFIEYVTPDECNGGFSPQPSYCTVVQPPPMHNVPEPMTWALFSIALIAMLVIKYYKIGDRHVHN